LRISRSCSRVRFSRRRRLSSSRSSVVRPSRRPASTSACLIQLRRVWLEMPRSSATWAIERSVFWTSCTASRRNSGVYGGLVGGIDSSLPESFDPSGQVSSKPGADQKVGRKHVAPARVWPWRGLSCRTRPKRDQETAGGGTLQSGCAGAVHRGTRASRECKSVVRGPIPMQERRPRREAHRHRDARRSARGAGGLQLWSARRGLASPCHRVRSPAGTWPNGHLSMLARRGSYSVP
jgi:hypothetical protein